VTTKLSDQSAGDLRGAVLIYKTPDGDFVNVTLGSAEVRSLSEWFKTERLKQIVDVGWRG
jgi:hypothetical protein